MIALILCHWYTIVSKVFSCMLKEYRLRNFPIHFMFVHKYVFLYVFSSSEPKAHWWAYRRRPSVRPSGCPSVCRSHSLNIFSSETTGPIETKFPMQSQWDGGTKVCSNGPGQMTKTAAMPVYGKNLKTIFFSGTERPMTLKLGMKHRVLKYYQVCSNDDPGLRLNNVFQKLLSSMSWN